MGTVQNISGEDLEVTLLRQVVKAGETVDVDDAQLDPATRLWAHSHWLVNGQPQIDVAPAVAEPTPEPVTPAAVVTE